ncbi:MAG: glutaredoxin family protein [Anaerolineae bacterium]|nr:glutaredoxin family protein [Anaerolineae bacterium]
MDKPNPIAKTLIMYSRTYGCPFITTAKRVLEREQVPYRELMIDRNPAYEKRVVEWTGFRSVPTLIVANEGEDMPYEPPAPLEKGASPRGINRGSMLTEASEAELMAWLRQHGFIA